MKFYFLLLLTLFLRVLSEINNPLLTSDHSVQLEAAKNFIQNGTFTKQWVKSADLSEIHQEPLKMWPIGLSIIVTILNYLTHNLIYAEILFQCIGVVFFILGIVKVLKLLNVSEYVVSLFLVLFAFNSAPFLYLGSTDLFTAALFIWVIYYTINELYNSNTSYLNIILISTLSFLAAVTRFACIPNLFIIPFVFLFIGVFKKSRKFLFDFALISLISFALTIVFYVKFPFSSGRTGFIDNIKTGTFYFSHLKWFDPFAIKAFFYTRPLEFRLPHNSNILFLYRAGLLACFILFLLLLISTIIKKTNFFSWLKKIIKNKLDKNDSLILVFFSTFLIVVSFISLQSITTLPESNSFGPSWMPPLWTFVYSTRYFVYPITLVIVMFFVSFQISFYENARPNLIFKSIYYMSLTWSLLFWSFTQYQYYSSKGNGAGSQWINKANSIAAFNVINEVHKSNLKTQIVYAHYENKFEEGLVTNYSYSYPTDDYNDIVAGHFSNSNKLILIMSMPNNLSNNELVFLEKHNHTILKNFKNEKLIKINL
jgi:hypothetical protein